MAVAHVVGGLSLDEGRVFRSHLLECTACRARVGELRAIAHDLADVERDERRVRAAKRTETKAREGDESEEPAPPANRLRGRVTVLIAAALTVLMALSAWNFLLRSRLQEAQERAASLRRAVPVLDDGQEWRVTSTSTQGIEGRVATLDQQMVVMVSGLVDRVYGLYLLSEDSSPVRVASVQAADGVIFEVIDDASVLAATEVLLMRSEQVTADPTGSSVFEATFDDDASQGESGTSPVTQPVVGAGGD